jgi:hypothetical protein
VSIVSAGTDIVAYLARERDDDATGFPTHSSANDDVAADEIPAYDDVAAEETPATADAETPATADAETPATAEAEMPAAVDEPAGWANEPDGGDASLAALAAQVGADEPAAQSEPALEQSAPSEPAPSPEPAVPAGWYADPSGRFELRYWDGTAWTEHVSRQGQQFTDPPVA